MVVCSSKDVSTHSEVIYAEKRVSFRDLFVITSAQPPRESSGTLAVWTSPVTAPDEVCTKPCGLKRISASGYSLILNKMLESTKKIDNDK